MEFLRKLEDLEVKEGTRVELAIEITKSESASNVVWQKDGQSVDKSLGSPSAPGYSVINKGSKHVLVIENATVHHEGEYIASVGEQECSCELTVVGKGDDYSSIFLSRWRSKYIAVR